MSKDDLIALAWPGSVVSDGNLSVQIHALRQALGDEVRIAVTSGRGYRLITPSGDADRPANGEAVESEPLGMDIPIPRVRLIGRETEVEAVGASFAKGRCVTVVGPGGVGKTSVALQAARELAPLYPDGVAFVQLVTLGAKAQIEEAVAGAVGLALAPGQPALDAMRRFLRSKRLLLVMDNCEHVLPVCAGIVEQLFQGCEGLSVLATSRERLAVQEEVVLQLAPLAYPPPGQPVTAEKALGYASVRLLVERASALDRDFRLTDADAPAAAEICARLDGIALAIELAAARLRTLSLAELASRLETRFSLLTRGQRTAPAQHQTLRALVDWSYDLLSTDEQRLLRRLSTFSGGWTLETAARVAGGSPLEPGSELEHLTSLVEKSLVVCDVADGVRRYRLLDTMHVYAREKALEAPEPDLPRRHAQAIIEVAARAAAAWPRAPTASWLAPLRPELDNIRAAMDWAFGPGDSALGVALLADALWLWTELGLVAEQRRWLATALDRVDSDTPAGVEAKLRLGAGMGAVRFGDRPNLSDLNRAAVLFEAQDDRLHLAMALVWSGVAQLNPGQPGRARTLLERALGLLRREPESKVLGQALNAMAAARFFAGEVDEAEALFAEAIEILRHLGDTSAVRIPMGNLAELYMLSGDVEAAITAGQGMVEACRDAGDLARLAAALASLAGYHLLKGDVAQAEALAREALPRNADLGRQAEIVQSIEIIAATATVRTDPDRAALLCGHTSAWYQQRGMKRDVAEQAAHERLQDGLAVLPAMRRIALLAEGRQWPEEEAIRAAMES